MVMKSERAQAPNFLDRLSGPARRALENAGITTLERLAGARITVDDIFVTGP